MPNKRMHATADTLPVIICKGLGRRVIRGVMPLPLMKNPEFWKPVIASVAVTPFMWLIAFASAGFGHGDFLGAKVLFPYAFLASVLPESAAAALIGWAVLLLSVVQYPLYGLSLALAVTRERLKFLPIGLGLAHVAAAASCVLFSPPW